MSKPPAWADVSRETLATLEAYAELLLKWNKTINLIAPSTIDELWERHIWDSYQLVELIPQNAIIADIGSGGGLPGLVIAISRPDVTITLIERDQRKCAFLTQAALTLGLKNVTVENKDIKTIPNKYQLVTGRALAGVDVLCELSHPLLLKDAICLFPKGENFATELDQARKAWDFTHAEKTSKTNNKACIITITELKPRF